MCFKVSKLAPAERRTLDRPSLLKTIPLSRRASSHPGDSFILRNTTARCEQIDLRSCCEH